MEASSGGSATPSGPRREEISVDGLTCVCLSELEAELRELYRGHLWVYDALRGAPGSTLLRGRRPVLAATLPGGADVVVKRLHHGGLLGDLTGDRFLTAERFRTQVALADQLASHGVPTPEVAFASWRRVRGFVRGEVATRRAPAGRDASDYFFAGPDPLPAGWREVAAGIGGTVARMHTFGVWHGDLNLMNLYVSRGGQIMVLDLDKGVLAPGAVDRGAREANLARLERSIRKQGYGHAAGEVEAVVAAVRDAYRRALA